MLRFAGVLFLLFLVPLDAHAEGRLALLIGNQSYSDKIGPLKNPHNDIALVGAALEKLGFKVTSVKDAGYKAIDTALRRHLQQVRRAGKDTISFVYYSGHGAADPDTRPGGNVTGVSLMSADLGGKRLQMLKELLPNLSRVAVIWNTANPNSERDFKETVVATRPLGSKFNQSECEAPPISRMPMKQSRGSDQML